MRRTALIVGAGIGGLAAGIALRQAGWDIRIFERAASPRELGFALLLAPNAMAALGELGVAETVLERGFAPVRGEGRRMDGAVLKRAMAPPPEALGGPIVVALRPAVHGALLEAVGAEALTLDHEITGFRADGERVVLQTADGDVAEGDLLVGADGAGSLIRRVLHPSEPPPRSSGIVAVRGATNGAVDHLGDLSAIYYLGRGVEAFLVRASETGIYWALSVAEELAPSGTRDAEAIVAHMAPRFEATFNAVTSAATDIRCDELFDRDALPFWSRGPVTLLGDAAHPLLPHTGQGAAQAITDAVALGKALASEASVSEALAAYEGERRPKTARLLGQGRRTARMMRTTNPVACSLRELAVRMLPVAQFVKMFAAINRRSGTDVSPRRRSR